VAIVSKRNPQIEPDSVDWVSTYDALVQNLLAGGLDAAQADRRAYAECCKQWIRQHPMVSLPMGNKGICCFCREKGADKPLSILGAGVMAHSGPGRAGKFELVPVAQTTNWEPNCWDAMVLHLYGTATIGLWCEGLKVDPTPWEFPAAARAAE
jgi:hypothetical protein